MSVAFDAHGRLWRAAVRDGHVWVDRSDARGRTFGVPARVNARAEAIGAPGELRPKLAAGPQGDIYVSWTQALACHSPGLALVLVGTDGAEQRARAQAYLARLGLLDGRTQHWLFADPDSARLVFAVDRQWRGELPRTYFHDGSGEVRAVSGRVAPQALLDWVQRLELASAAQQSR